MFQPRLHLETGGRRKPVAIVSSGTNIPLSLTDLPPPTPDPTNGLHQQKQDPKDVVLSTVALRSTQPAFTPHRPVFFPSTLALCPLPQQILLCSTVSEAGG